MAHDYELGRLNLPFVGICTFGKAPYQPDWTAIAADLAVLGAPFDCATQWRSGARFGPRAVREASPLFSFGHAGAYDHEDDVTYLNGVRMVDLGDADIVHTDTLASHANIEAGVSARSCAPGRCRWLSEAIIRSTSLYPRFRRGWPTPHCSDRRASRLRRRTPRCALRPRQPDAAYSGPT